MIPDSHTPLSGLRPELFHIGGLSVTSYGFFMALGIVAAVAWFWRESPGQSESRKRAWAIVLGALLFGSIGAKAMALALNAPAFPSLGLHEVLYSGRSILGGVIGGWVGVVLVKRLLRIRSRHGNAIAPAVALGIAIGRIGCLLGSCCYGIPTSLPFGIDFGDGRSRHPTQVYEALFALILWRYFSWRNKSLPPGGVLFRQFLAAYLTFRFVVEFIRVEPPFLFGLTFYQVFAASCLLVLASLARKGSARPDLAQSRMETTGAAGGKTVRLSEANDPLPPPSTTILGR